MSWIDILKNENKFPSYIRVDGTDYELSSTSGYGSYATAGYNNLDIGRGVSFKDGHIEGITLEYALKHSIDSEYQKEIQEESLIDYDTYYYQLDEDED